MVKKIVLTLITLNLALYADFYYSGGKKHILKEVKKSKNLSDKNRYYYQTANGTNVSVGTKLIVSFSDLNIQKNIEKKYNLTLVKALTDTMFLYSIKNSSKTVEIANTIYSEKGVKFSHPDFKRKKILKALTKDPYVYKAWYLKDNYYHNNSDINIEEAWNYTKGEGVKIAVYDKGIDIDHPDLKENIIAFENFNDPNSNIPYSNDDKNWHGTACAGIISAVENRIGSVGIAPKASLYAVGYSESEISKDIEAFTWLMKEGVSVINNSWGSYENLDAYNEIFKELATKGRDGKGIILVFAAGNGLNSVGYNLDDADINDESESPYVISVTAATRRNKIARYSNYGSAVDFTAPGGDSSDGLFTTDARGMLGYTSYEYTSDFIGTSAAAPVVSATVALMLSANPNLTRDEVIKILKSTSDKLGNYTYDKNGHNNHWGYGKINAGRAVKLAYTYGKSKLKNFVRTIFTELK
jgi:subtilisin family serine protease